MQVFTQDARDLQGAAHHVDIIVHELFGNELLCERVHNIIPAVRQKMERVAMSKTIQMNNDTASNDTASKNKASINSVPFEGGAYRGPRVVPSEARTYAVLVDSKFLQSMEPWQGGDHAHMISGTLQLQGSLY